MCFECKEKKQSQQTGSENQTHKKRSQKRKRGRFSMKKRKKIHCHNKTTNVTNNGLVTG